MQRYASQDKSDSGTLSIRRFNPNKQMDGPAIFIGTPANGYSSCIQYYLSQIKKQTTPEHSEVYVFCDRQNTDGYTNLMKTDPFFSKSVASIFPDMATNDMIPKLECILENHKKVRREDIACSSNDEHRIYIVIENLHDPVLYSSRVFNEIMRSGKIWRVTMILHQQYASGLSPQIRCSIDYVFMAYTKNKSSKKMVYDSYGGVINTFKQFCPIFDELTRDGQWMVVNKRTLSSQIEDTIYYLRIE